MIFELIFVSAAAHFVFEISLDVIAHRTDAAGIIQSTLQAEYKADCCVRFVQLPIVSHWQRNENLKQNISQHCVKIEKRRKNVG